jgi:hypothetical protein
MALELVVKKNKNIHLAFFVTGCGLSGGEWQQQRMRRSRDGLDYDG